MNEILIIFQKLYQKLPTKNLNHLLALHIINSFNNTRNHQSYPQQQITLKKLQYFSLDNKKNLLK